MVMKSAIDVDHCTFLVDVDSCLFLSRQQAALFITPFPHDHDYAKKMKKMGLAFQTQNQNLMF